MKKPNSDIRLIAQNKKAYHDYFIEDVYQAGISLYGTEVKSLRAGKCNLKESFVKVLGNEVFILNMHISPYEQGNIFNKEPDRTRRLLLNRREINKLIGATVREGYTIVPTRIYFSKSLVKIDIALAKGKKNYDKREAMAKKDALRSAQIALKERNRE